MAELTRTGVGEGILCCKKAFCAAKRHFVLQIPKWSTPETQTAVPKTQNIKSSILCCIRVRMLDKRFCSFKTSQALDVLYEQTIAVHRTIIKEYSWQYIEHKLAHSVPVHLFFWKFAKIAPRTIQL